MTIDIPRPRDRSQIIHHPAYYTIRNHLVEFLVRRSKELAGVAAPEAGASAVYPREVNPAKLVARPVKAGVAELA